MRKLILFTLLSFILISNAFAVTSQQTFPIKELYKIGDVFNIEGGTPAQNLNKGKIWVNLAMVLDRPLIEGVTLDEITAKNNYPLKEMSIEEYNETNVNLSFLLISNYYIENGHKLLNKSPNEPLHFLIQVHRNSSGPKMIDNLAKLMTDCLNKKFKQSQDSQGLPQLSLEDKNRNIIIHFRKGVKGEETKHYDNVDILFSVSLVGGLSPKLPTGTLTFAKEFIPFNIDSYELFPNKKYTVTNRLHQDLEAILAQNQEIYFEKLNTTFKSPNQDKYQPSRILTQKDFHITTSLQINGNFYPKDPEKQVSVMK